MFLLRQVYEITIEMQINNVKHHNARGKTFFFFAENYKKIILKIAPNSDIDIYIICFFH